MLALGWVSALESEWVLESELELELVSVSELECQCRIAPHLTQRRRNQDPSRQFRQTCKPS